MYVQYVLGGIYVTTILSSRGKVTGLLNMNNMDGSMESINLPIRCLVWGSCYSSWRQHGSQCASQLTGMKAIVVLLCVGLLQVVRQLMSFTPPLHALTRKAPPASLTSSTELCFLFFELWTSGECSFEPSATDYPIRSQVLRIIMLSEQELHLFPHCDALYAEMVLMCRFTFSATECVSVSWNDLWFY